MAGTGPPAGWYPDPAGGGGLRWWDGSAWTSGLAPPISRPTVGALVDEASAARWARAALLVAAPAQFTASVLMRRDLRELLDHVRHLGDEAATATPHWFGGAGAVAAQALAAVGTVTGVIFLIWFARSAHNARALGLPARREPAAAVAGFIVPIINLWWPYQSTSDLMADEDASRTLVLRWFLLWVVGGCVGAVVNIASAFVDSWLGWALLIVPGALVTLAALAARQVVSMAVSSHEALARRSASVASPGA